MDDNKTDITVKAMAASKDNLRIGNRTATDNLQNRTLLIIIHTALLNLLIIMRETVKA